MEDGTYRLRMKGFVGFEATAKPPKPGYTFKNVPEVSSQLRLYLRSAGGWQQEVAVELSDALCEWQPNKELFQACLADAKRKSRTSYSLGDLSIDLGDTQALDIELLVQGWPRYVSLSAQLQAALGAPPADADGGGVRTLHRTLPYHASLPVPRLARILEWSEQYHTSLGFAGTYMYALPKDVAELEAHPGIRSLVARRQLTIILWDEFATYKVGLAG
jgi:hypothetical protein